MDPSASTCLPLRPRSITVQWGATWLIVPAAKTPDQSWEFLKHLTSTEMLLAFNEPLGTIPPRKSAQGKGYLAEPQLRDVVDLYLKYGQPQYKYPIPQEMNPGISTPLQDATVRKVSPKEALDAAARTWDAVMQREDFRDDVT